jgi:hypothetical protein
MLAVIPAGAWAYLSFTIVDANAAAPLRRPGLYLHSGLV